MKRKFCFLTGTKLKYTPGIIVGGSNLVHDCGVSRAIGYFLEPLILLGLFARKPLIIILKGNPFFGWNFKILLFFVGFFVFQLDIILYYICLARKSQFLRHYCAMYNDLQLGG